MKIIELLNKIANGEEVPEKIAIQNKVLIYNEGEILNLQDCYYMNDDEDATWEIWAYKLNDKVEIIEEPQEHKIPSNIFLNQTDGNCYIDTYSYKQVPLKREKLSPEQISIINKINEILDYLEKIE